MTSFALTTLFLFLIMLMRYFSVAGLFYLLVWKRPLRWRERELNSDKPSRSAIRREILWSISATLIFAVPGAFMLEGWELGWTRIYLEPTRYSWSYFVLSPLLYMALHDTYFYWTHRLLHQPWWYRHAHYVHHESLSPSPWASFSFSSPGVSDRSIVYSRAGVRGTDSCRGFTLCAHVDDDFRRHQSSRL